jgi:hypothetical protein
MRGRRVASFMKPCPVNNITSSRRKTQAATQPLFYSHYRQLILKVIIQHNSDESFEAEGGGCGTCGSNMPGGLLLYTFIILFVYCISFQFRLLSKKVFSPTTPSLATLPEQSGYQFVVCLHVYLHRNIIVCDILLKSRAI